MHLPTTPQKSLFISFSLTNFPQISKKVIFWVLLVDTSRKFSKHTHFWEKNTSINFQKFWDTSTKVGWPPPGEGNSELKGLNPVWLHLFNSTWFDSTCLILKFSPSRCTFQSYRGCNSELKWLNPVWLHLFNSTWFDSAPLDSELNPTWTGEGALSGTLW